MTYATEANVTPLLGQLAGRLPGWVNVEEYLEIANAEVVEALGDVYPDNLPAFAGPGLAVVKLAEAKLATAAILSALRVNLPKEAQDVPEAMRAEALATLSNAVVGYPVGGVDVPGSPTPRKVGNSPRHSSFTPMSAFADPYAAARVAEGSEVGW